MYLTTLKISNDVKCVAQKLAIESKAQHEIAKWPSSSFSFWNSSQDYICWGTGLAGWHSVVIQNVFALLTVL